MKKIDNQGLDNSYIGLNGDQAKDWLDKVSGAKGKDKKDMLLGFKKQFGANFNEANLNKIIADEEALKNIPVSVDNTLNQPPTINAGACAAVAELNKLVISNIVDEDKDAQAINDPTFTAAAAEIDSDRVKVLFEANEKLRDIIIGKYNNLSEKQKKDLSETDMVLNELIERMKVAEEGLNNTSISEDDKNKHLEAIKKITEAWEVSINKKKEIINSPEPISSLKPGVNPRELLEKIKIKEGGINEEQAKFSNKEYAKTQLQEELKELSGLLLSETPSSKEKDKLAEFQKRKEDLVKNLVAKTGLSEEEIKNIYQAQEQHIGDIAKYLVQNETSLGRKIGGIALKSGVYLGAGFFAATTTAATLGIGGFAGAGIIASARVIDRYLTEKSGEKKINKEISWLKRNVDDDEFNGFLKKNDLEDRFISSISMQKKIEIEKVNLNKDENSRDRIISEFIAENLPAGIEQRDIPEYQETMLRVLKGLDFVEELNAEKEQALIKKPNLLDKIKKVEGKIFGETTAEKTVSTAVIAGLGLAAREIPGIRECLFGYMGWRIGGAVGDSFIKHQNKKYEVDLENLKSGDDYNYGAARRKLLDKDFQLKDPQKYEMLKANVQKVEFQNALRGNEELDFLNSSFEREIKAKKTDSKLDKILGLTTRVAGAMIGVIGAELAAAIVQSYKESHGANVPRIGSAKGGNVNEIHHKDTNIPHESSDKTEVVPRKPEVVPNKSEIVPNKPSVVSKTGVQTGSKNVNVPKHEVFSDKISNKGLNGKSDSVWRSTREIFKNNAEKLGYKGDIKDSAALNRWAEVQTGNTIHNSGTLTDKVFEGNNVILEKDASGHFQVKVETGTGHQPEVLRHVKAGGNNKIETLSNKSRLEEIPRIKPIDASRVDGHIADKVASLAHPTGQANNTLEHATKLGQSKADTAVIKRIPIPKPPIADKVGAKGVSSITEALNQEAADHTKTIAEVASGNNLNAQDKILLEFAKENGAGNNTTVGQLVNQHNELALIMSSDKPAENFYAVLYDLRHATTGQSEIMINTLKSQLGGILNGKGSLDKFNELIKNNSFGVSNGLDGQPSDLLLTFKGKSIKFDYSADGFEKLSNFVSSLVKGK